MSQELRESALHPPEEGTPELSLKGREGVRPDAVGELGGWERNRWRKDNPKGGNCANKGESIAALRPVETGQLHVAELPF